MNPAGGGGTADVRKLGCAILGATLLLKGDAVDGLLQPRDEKPRLPTRDIDVLDRMPDPGFGAASDALDAIPSAQPPIAAPSSQGPEPAKREGPLPSSPPRVDTEEADFPAVASTAEPEMAELPIPAPSVQGAIPPPAIADMLNAPVQASDIAPPPPPLTSDEEVPAAEASAEVDSLPVPTFGQPVEDPLENEADPDAERAPVTPRLMLVSAVPDLPEPSFGAADSPFVAAGDADEGLVPPVTEIPEPASGSANPAPQPRQNAADAPVVPPPDALAEADARPSPPQAPVPMAVAEGSQRADLSEPVFGEAPEARPSGDGAKIARLDVGPGASAIPVPAFGRPVEQPRSDANAGLVVAKAPLDRQGDSTVVKPSQGAAAAKLALVDTAARMSSDGAPVISYDDELILQIETSKGEVADTIIAYGTRSGVYLPFGALTRFLDLGIAVSDDGHFASGWFIDETRTLTVDLRQGTLTVQGRDRPLEKRDAVAFDGDLYIRAERYADILPLKLSVSLRDQAVRIETLEPFPFEQRLAREAQREQLSSSADTETVQQWPREETPWSPISFPLGDVELRAVSDQIMDSRLEGDLRVAGDLAYMTAQAFASVTTRDGLTGARLELGRRDPDARLLGPMQASEFEIGDVSTDALPLGLRGTAGRGVFVTNSPLERASVFDVIDLRGELPNGYEVELYRNNILLRSTRRSENGQFAFLQVPVDYGLNVFRLIFYGPQGQRREEVRRISVGDGRLSPGEFLYTFGSAQKDVNLFGVEGPQFSPSQDYGAWRTTALLEYGLSSDVTVGVAGAWFDSDEGKRWMTSAGLRTGLGDIAMKFDVGAQSHGTAVQAGVAGVIFGIGYTVNHAEYSGEFVDEVHSFSSDFLKRATDVNFNSTLELGEGQDPFVLPISGRFRRVEYADDRTTTDLSLRASARVATFLVSNTLDYNNIARRNEFSASQLLGSFDLATLSGSRTNYRASVNYALVPTARFTAASIEVDHAIDDRTLVRGAISQTFVGDETQFSLSGIRDFDDFTLAFDGNYGVRQGSYSVALRLGFSFGRNPMTHQLFVDRPGLASGGAVAIRAYHDVNGDRRFDAGDKLLPDVEFGTTSGHGKTDANGTVFLSELGDGTRTSFQVAEDTLPDIALAPVNRGVEIVPRPGRIHVTDFGIQALSEIEGTAYFKGGSADRGVSGLSLQLVNSSGAVVAIARTEGDGFYLFEQVPPGRYTIELDPGQAQRLKIYLPQRHDVEVDAEGAVLRKSITIHAIEAVGATLTP